MDSEQVLKLLRRSDALLEGHFQLSSGRHSNRYFQCALVLADPRHAEQLARALVARLRVELELVPELVPDLVVGPALGAVVWAQEVARALGTRAYFTEREDGAMVLRRGFRVRPDERVLVVEDVLTTGGSVREVLAALRAQGAVPIGVGAIVNRSGTPQPFAAENLSLAALAEVQVESWTPQTCPLCASKTAGPAVKPGSRPGAPPASRAGRTVG